MTQADCERKALLKDVVALPDEDWPRLIYADWCEDNGEPDRAEFIRLQIQIGRRDPLYHIDESASWAIHERSAIPEVRRAVDCLRRMNLCSKEPGGWNPDSRRVWRRGFIEETTFDLKDWRKQGPTLIEEVPFRVVRLRGKQPARSAHPGVWSYWEESTHSFLDSWDVPPDLFELLEGFDHESRRSANYPSRQRNYEHQSQAVAAMSAALLRLAGKT